jgi:hypothetical protein
MKDLLSVQNIQANPLLWIKKKPAIFIHGTFQDGKELTVRIIPVRPVVQDKGAFSVRKQRTITPDAKSK